MASRLVELIFLHHFNVLSVNNACDSKGVMAMLSQVVWVDCELLCIILLVSLPRTSLLHSLGSLQRTVQLAIQKLTDSWD